MAEVGTDPAKSAGWPKPAALSGILVRRNLMCHKTEVSVGNLGFPAGLKAVFPMDWKGILSVWALCASCLCCCFAPVSGSLPCATGTLIWKKHLSKSSLFLASRLS